MANTNKLKDTPVLTNSRPDFVTKKTKQNPVIIIIIIHSQFKMYNTLLF